ncbi:MAG: alpha/beta hydrolase [Candidatus Binatia bacterium]
MATSREANSKSEKTPASAASPGIGFIDFQTLPAGTTEEVVTLAAEDGGASRGVLYRRGGEKTVVCFMHPRADMSRHYAIPTVLEAGYAAFGHQNRWLNNDIACIHEVLLADVAAGVRFLKEVKGFERVILFGNSGGGSLYAFYQGQAVTPPPGRLTDTPAGDPYDLNRFQMPPADGLIFFAVHLGEGVFMLDKIDPSVTAESDPLSCDPSLDMYNPANGFRELPEQSKYSAEFLERYRPAQRARVARLDAIARKYVEEQRYFQELMRQPEFQKLPLERKQFINRRAVVGPYMIIYRTEADPAYCDLSLNAKHSTRKVGSLITPRPDLFNYMEGGFSRYQTPRAWLSNWSGLSSRAAILANLPKITVPTLVVSFTADNACFPDSSEAMYQQSLAQDKQIAYVDANHFGYPLTGREEALNVMAQWLRERFAGR